MFLTKPNQMKTFCKSTLLIVLLLLINRCSPQQNEHLTQQQKELITKEIMTVGDSIMAKVEGLDEGWLDYYAETPDWGMANSDGSRWDYQTTKNVQPDFFNSIISWKWTTTHRDLKFLSKDIVLCAWDGKDETIMKPGDKVKVDTLINNMYNKEMTTLRAGDKIVINPHTYTLIFKKINGFWKVIYSHDSGYPVTNPEKKK
jgi:hypothetical protein